MPESEIASLTARLELDDADFTTKIDADKTALDDFKTKADDLTATLSVDDSDFKASLESATTATNDLGNKNVAVKVQTEGATEAKSAIETVSTALTNLGGAVKVAGVVAAFALMAEGADALGKAIDNDILKFADLQEASTQAALRSGQETGAGIEHVSKEIMDAAEKYSVASGVDANKITPVLAALKQQGLDTSSYEAVRPYIDLARGTNTKPEEVEKSIRTISAQTGIQDRKKIADVLAKAYMESGLNPTDLRRAMAIAQPISKQLGGFEGEVALFSKMQQLGYNPSTVATTLSMAESEFNRGGLDKRLVGAGMPQQKIDTLKQQGVMPLLTEMQNEGIDFSKIFSGRQSPVLETIAKNKNEIGKLTEKLVDAKGATDLMGKALDKDLASSMNKAKEATTEFSTTVGEQFAPTAKTMADATTTIASGLSDAIKKAAEGDTTGAADALNNVIKGIVKLVGDSLPETVKKAVDFPKTLEDILKKIDYDYLGALLAKGLTDVWNTGWAAIDNITSGDFSTKTKDAVIDAVGSIMTGMKQLLGPTLMQIADAAIEAWSGVARATAPVYAMLETGFQQIQHAGATCWNSLIDGAQGLANAIRSGILNAIADVLGGMADLLDAAGSVLDSMYGLGSKIPTPSGVKGKIDEGITKNDTSDEKYWANPDNRGTPGSQYTFPRSPDANALLDQLNGGYHAATVKKTKTDTSSKPSSLPPQKQPTSPSTATSPPAPSSESSTAKKHKTDTSTKPASPSSTPSTTKTPEETTPDTTPKVRGNLIDWDPLGAWAKKNNANKGTPSTEHGKGETNQVVPPSKPQLQLTQEALDSLAESGTAPSAPSADSAARPPGRPQSTARTAKSPTPSQNQNTAAIADQTEATEENTRARNDDTNATKTSTNIFHDLAAELRLEAAVLRGKAGEPVDLQTFKVDDTKPLSYEENLAARYKALDELDEQHAKDRDVRNKKIYDALGLGAKPNPVVPTRPGYSVPNAKSIDDTSVPHPTVPIAADPSRFNKSWEDIKNKTESPLSTKVDVDTSQVGKDLADLRTKTESPLSTTISADTSQAGKDLEDLKSKAESPRSIKITADTSQALAQIASLEARASQPVTKTIYIQEVHTGGGGGNWGSGAEGRSGIYRPPQGTTIYDPPMHRIVRIGRFGAGNAWVKEPTLAVVGDAPGGEGIFTAAQVKNMSKSITVNVGDIHIAQPGASMDEIVETIGHKIAMATMGL